LAENRLSFLRNHREALAAMDFFTVPTFTFSLIYCFLLSAMTDGASSTSTSCVITPVLGLCNNYEKRFPTSPLHGFSSWIVTRSLGFHWIVIPRWTSVGVKELRFCSRSFHGSLRITTAMAAGINDDAWSVEERLSAGV
jgi:hypothetical protein